MFHHREIPDIRIRDMELHLEFKRLTKYVLEIDQSEALDFDRYNQMVDLVLAQFLNISERRVLASAETEDVCHIVADAVGAAFECFCPDSQAHIDWFAGFGMLVGESGLQHADGLPVLANGVHVGVLARMTEAAQPQFRSLCSLAVQQGYRMRVSSPRNISLKQSVGMMNHGFPLSS